MEFGFVIKTKTFNQTWRKRKKKGNKRFWNAEKKTPSSVMVANKNNQYTIKDTRRKREPIKFALVITRTIKTTNMPVFNQMIFIYTGIELKFRRDLSKPSENIIMDACLQK